MVCGGVWKTLLSPHTQFNQPPLLPPRASQRAVSARTGISAGGGRERAAEDVLLYHRGKNCHFLLLVHTTTMKLYVQICQSFVLLVFVYKQPAKLQQHEAAFLAAITALISSSLSYLEVYSFLQTAPGLRYCTGFRMAYSIVPFKPKSKLGKW